MAIVSAGLTLEKVSLAVDLLESGLAITRQEEFNLKPFVFTVIATIVVYRLLLRCQRKFCGRRKPAVCDLGFQTDPEYTSNYYGIIHSKDNRTRYFRPGQRHNAFKDVQFHIGIQQFRAAFLNGELEQPVQHIELHPDFQEDV